MQMFSKAFQQFRFVVFDLRQALLVGSFDQTSKEYKTVRSYGYTRIVQTSQGIVERFFAQIALIIDLFDQQARWLRDRRLAAHGPERDKSHG